MGRSSYKDNQYQTYNEANNNNNVGDQDSDLDDEHLGNGNWDGNRLLPRPPEEDGLSEVSASAANVTNDGKHPLLEFAMKFFREGQEKFDNLEMADQGSLKDKAQKARKKKSSGSNEA